MHEWIILIYHFNIISVQCQNKYKLHLWQTSGSKITLFTGVYVGSHWQLDGCKWQRDEGWNVIKQSTPVVWRNHGNLM